MTSPGVVEALDIVQNIGFGMGFGEIGGAVHTLVFQCGEERFRQAIDAPIVCDCYTTSFDGSIEVSWKLIETIAMK